MAPSICTTHWMPCGLNERRSNHCTTAWGVLLSDSLCHPAFVSVKRRVECVNVFLIETVLRDVKRLTETLEMNDFTLP